MPPASRDHAGRQHHDIGRIAPTVGNDTGRAAGGNGDFAHRAMLDEFDPGAVAAKVSARPSRRFSTWWSLAPHGGGDPGLQMAPSARLGSIEPSKVETEPLLELEGMAQLGGVVRLAVTIVLVAIFRRDPDAASTSRAKSGHRRWLSSASGKSGTSPGSVSTAAASMPAAAQLAPCPASPRSYTVTLQPASTSRQAMPRPMTPAPTTIVFGRCDGTTLDAAMTDSLHRVMPGQVQWV
jgi:hypothetical protein